MRQRIFGVLAATTILAIGGAAYAFQAAQYRMVAGPVTGSYKHGINATFRLEAVLSGGLESTGHGGACIIFPAKDVGLVKMAKIQCSTDSDCASTENPGHLEAHGYCEVQTKMCWAKPVKPSPEAADAAVCERSLQRTPPAPWTPGVDNSISTTPIKLKQMGVKKHTRARVLTCLHGIPVGGCFNPNLPVQTEWGTVTQL